MSIAPHLLDSRLRGDLSDDDQESVESYRHFLQQRHMPDSTFAESEWFEQVENLAQWPQASDDEIAKSLDSLIRYRHTSKLEEAAADIVSELPAWVWNYFSHAMRIPMPPRMRASTIRAGGTAAAVRVLVFSRGCNGAEVESFLRSHAGPLRVPSDPGPVSKGSFAGAVSEAVPSRE